MSERAVLEKLDELIGLMRKLIELETPKPKEKRRRMVAEVRKRLAAGVDIVAYNAFTDTLSFRCQVGQGELAKGGNDAWVVFDPGEWVSITASAVGEVRVISRDKWEYVFFGTEVDLDTPGLFYAVNFERQAV